MSLPGNAARGWGGGCPGAPGSVLWLRGRRSRQHVAEQQRQASTEEQGRGHASLRLKGEHQGRCLQAELSAAKGRGWPGGFTPTGCTPPCNTCLCKLLTDIKPCSPRHVSSYSTRMTWSTYQTKKQLRFAVSLQDPRAEACQARHRAPALPGTLFYLSYR